MTANDWGLLLIGFGVGVIISIIGGIVMLVGMLARFAVKIEEAESKAADDPDGK